MSVAPAAITHSTSSEDQRRRRAEAEVEQRGRGFYYEAALWPRKTGRVGGVVEAGGGASERLARAANCEA